MRLSDWAEVRLLCGRPLPGIPTPPDLPLSLPHGILLLSSLRLSLTFSLEEEVPGLLLGRFDLVLVLLARSLSSLLNDLQLLMRRQTHPALGAVGGCWREHVQLSGSGIDALDPKVITTIPELAPLRSLLLRRQGAGYDCLW